MKKTKKILTIICLTIVMALGAPLVAPLPTQFTTVEAATKIKLNKTNVYVSKGDTVQLSLKGTSKKVKWYSTNKKIATVNNKGKVRGIKKGKTTVTAEVNGKKYRCTINVEVPSISKKNVSLNKGSSTTLKIKNTKQKIKWSSSNKKVATVNSKGKVKGIKDGKATITAKVGSKKYTCKVTVKKVTVKVNSISLNESNITLYMGESKTLKATVFPSNATNKTITWSSSNGRVAKVDKGTIKAVAPGTATIKAEAGGKKSTCKVIIKEHTVETITLNKSEIKLNIGETSTLKATISPQNVKNKEVIWSSSNNSIATVDSGIVKAISPGTVTITATSGGKRDSCTVIVNDYDIAIILTSYNLEIEKGKQAALGATITPSYAINKKVTWSSENTNIATVNQNGMITAVEMGECNIIATCGSKSAVCRVTVNGTPADRSVLEIYSDFPSGTNYMLVCKKGNVEIVNAENGKIDIHVEYTVQNLPSSKTSNVAYSYMLLNESGVIRTESIKAYIEPGDTLTFGREFKGLSPGTYHLCFEDY